MHLSDFFEPVPAPRPTVEYMPLEDTLRCQVKYADGASDYVDEVISDCDIAIVQITDGKNALGNEGCKSAAENIMSSLLGLRKATKALKVINLGNVRGKSLNDRYFVLSEVVGKLSLLEVCCLVIGGGQDYVLPAVKGLNSHKRNLSISLIDAKLDMHVGDTDFNSQTYLSKLIQDYKEGIFELNVLGSQKYLIGETQEACLNENNWQVTRIKDLRNENISLSESLLRDADLIAFDVGAIQKEYMPYWSNVNVNGFTGYEACQLAWYAGVSDAVKVFCVQEFNPEVDETGKGAMLCAEMLWHFLEGISQEMSVLPSEESGEFKICVVHLQDFGIDIRFYSNRVNNRWWIEVPWKNGKKMLACDKKDYLLAQSGELPDRWWRFFQQDS